MTNSFIMFYSEFVLAKKGALGKVWLRDSTIVDDMLMFWYVGNKNA